MSGLYKVFSMLTDEETGEHVTVEMLIALDGTAATFTIVSTEDAGETQVVQTEGPEELRIIRRLIERMHLAAAVAP